MNVSASWPGASASDVAEAIAAPLETQLNGVDHMLYMESTSSDEGTYRLSITFAAGTDADLAAIDVQNRVAQALAQLPAEVQQNGVQVRKRASNLLMGVSLYSPLGTLTPLFVSNYASTQVREALARLPGVGEVQMFGARDYSMRIWLRPDRMNALNITTDDVARRCASKMCRGAAGQVGTPPVFNGQQQTLTINGLGRLNEAASFGEIILRRGAQGQLVRLADVATIELGARSYSSGAQLNGKASAYLGIYPTPTANALQVASAVRAELNRLHTRFPADLTWEVKFDTTRFVAATIKGDRRLAGADPAGGGRGGVAVFAELAGDADRSAGDPGVTDRHLCGALSAGLQRQHPQPVRDHSRPDDGVWMTPLWWWRMWKPKWRKGWIACRPPPRRCGRSPGR